MHVSAIQGTEAVNNNMQLKKVVAEEQPAVLNNVEGYAQKEEAPTDANLYKAMYGIENKKSDDQNYKEAMGEHLEKWGTDEQVKEFNEKKDIESEEDEKYYNQYLEYKHKYD